MAFLDNRIDEINQQLDRLDRDIAEKQNEIDRLEDPGALNARDVQVAELQELFRGAEALSAERNALQDQQGDLNSAKGQTAGDKGENTQPPTFQGEGVQAFQTNSEPLTEEEENRAAGAVFNPDGEAVAFGAERPTIASEDDEYVIPGLQGGASSNLITTAGQQTNLDGDPTRQQNALAHEAAAPENLGNVLNNYASYTYIISLYLLTTADYATLTDDPTKFVPTNLLIQSGGGGQGIRHKDFTINFGIDNFKMYSVVGLNASSQGSNTLTFDFDIIEPYGMTLLDRLISANLDTGSGNYLEQPYLLKIDFIGNASDPNSGNNFKIDSKSFPIKFQNMKINPSDGSTVYKISAIAFNHSAFQQTRATVPVMLSVKAKTVGEFFGNGTPNKKILSMGESDTGGGYGMGAAPEPITAYGSFPSGVNSFYSSISGPDKLNKIPPTTIKFNIDPAFVDSLIVDPLSTETNTVPMGPRDGHQNSSWGSRGIAKSRTEQIFPIQSGTNINSVIDRIMRKSDYITSQIKDFNTARKTLQDGDNLDEFKFLNWYKVIPEVNLGRYDDGVQAYAYEITYNVVQYRTANTKHPDFAKTRITKDNIVRTYNYRYTGKNIDVIDLDINFDTAYYTAMTAFPKNKALAGGAIIDKRKSADPQFNEQNNAAPGATTQGNPVQLTATGGGSGGGQFNRTSDFKSVTVDDLAQSIYSSSAGDMLSIQLKIIGDPAFIKQDDIFYNPSRNGYNEYISFLKGGLPINKSGQIVFDTNQVYVQLLVHSATDIDDTVGIVNPNKIITLSSGNSIDSTFSGAYQVLTVETTLNEGQFEQDLHIIKIPNFLTDKVTNNSVTTEWSNYLAPGASDDNAVSAPPVQVVSDALGIQGNDMSKLVAASNSDPDGVFPIVNGAGTTPAPQQVTESSPANINDSVAFNGQLVNTQTG